MDRRSFLARLTGGLAATFATTAVVPAEQLLAAATFDPDHALWVPGAKTFHDLGALKPFQPLIDPVVAQNEAVKKLYAEFLRSMAEDFARQVGPQFAHEPLTHPHLAGAGRALLVTVPGSTVPQRVPFTHKRLPGFRTPADLPAMAFDVGHDGVATAMDKDTGVLVRVVQYHQAGQGTLTDFEVLGREARGNDLRLLSNRHYRHGGGRDFLFKGGA